MATKPKIRLRYPLPYTSDQRPAWETAAATCGKTLSEWISATCDAEAKKATHVPMVKREGRRG